MRQCTKNEIKNEFPSKTFSRHVPAYGNIICLYGLDKTILDNTLLERITDGDDWLNGKMICFFGITLEIQFALLDIDKGSRGQNKYFYFTVYHCPFGGINGYIYLMVKRASCQLHNIL